MQNRFRQAREERRLSAIELAERLDVHPSTITNWEAGRRQITSDKLLQISEILDFSVDYLLGKNCVSVSQTDPVSMDTLPALHGQPVWTVSRGWMLVNIVKTAFVTHDLSLVAFDEVSEPIYLVPPMMSFSLRGMGNPLRLDTVLRCERVWVEPITTDIDLSAGLRGWYHLYDKRLVQNEFGHRFYSDTYGVKWLAFVDCFGGCV